ncbi:hypothetical protein EMIT0373P_40652 [Pseudomonas chlororaphis]
MQRPWLFPGAGDLSQCLFHPRQFGGLVIQYCDTHAGQFLLSRENADALFEAFPGAEFRLIRRI